MKIGYEPCDDVFLQSRQQFNRLQDFFIDYHIFNSHGVRTHVPLDVNAYVKSWGVWTDIQSNNPIMKRKCKYYTMVLYPDNLHHLELLYVYSVICKYPVAFIVHCPDNGCIDDSITSFNNELGGQNEQQKKKHIHLMVKFDDSRSLVSVLREVLRYGVNYCSPVSSPKALLRYFIHQTPEAIDEHKELYTYDDIYRTYYFDDIVRSLQRRDDDMSNGFISSDLSDCLLALQECKDMGMSFHDTMITLSQSERYCNILKSYQSIITNSWKLG